MSEAEKGIVNLIGAGPGDPELITVRGKRLLQSCDVVIYDNLVPAELVVALPESIDKRYVGKKAGRHSLPQDEINALLFKLASEGKTVARLKGGDPLIFSRGAEEAEFLKKNNIRFEIVPGITSGMASPAYAGIPCTDRRKASFVILATGHKAGEKEFSSVPWDWIARAKQGTLVIYMGISELHNIVEKLIDAGMPEDMPSAVIERGTFPSQRVATAPLQRLPDISTARKIAPPAIIVIGEVVDLQPYLKWFENKPLLGLRVMVTRASHQAAEIYDSLRNHGVEVLPYPTIAIKENFDPDAWEKFDRIATEDKWLAFTSENGVKYFIEQYLARNIDIRHLKGYRIAAIGSGTRNALKKLNLTADFIPSVATVEAFARQFGKQFDLDGSTVVRVRGNLADENLEETLSECGANVLPLNVYRTYNRIWPDGFKDKLFDYPPGVIIFTSGSTIDGLFANMTDGEVKKLASGAKIASIGPSTTKTIESRGLSVSFEAEEHSIPGLIKTIVKYFKDNPGG